MSDQKPSRSRPKEVTQKETIRASISFTSEDYEELERRAAEKKVSLAWIVREAVSQYIQDDTQEGTLPAKERPHVS